MKKIILGTVFIALLTAGCEKEDSIPTRFTPNPASNTNVKFLMLSPDAPPVNFFANGVKSSSLLVPSSGIVQGMVFPGVFPSIVGYATIPSGSIKIDTKVTDSSTVMPGEVLLSTTQTLDAGKFYTYVVMDSVSKITSVFVEDDLSVPNTAVPYYRLANFTSNSPTMKIQIRKTTGETYPFPIVSTTDLAFKSVTPFSEMEAETTYRIYLLNPVTDAKLDSISGFAPTAGRKYTIYTRGVFGLTGTNTRRPIITSYTNL